jgi:ribosomal protein S18 acetylase RimI-like enzyme
MLDIRPLLSSDQDQLWNWLHIALWDPPPAPLRPRAVLDDPLVRIYAENWGRAGDVGVAGEVDGRTVGACWMRLLPQQSQGLAYVDEETPQLGIGLLPEFQAQGHGPRLMLAALEAARAHGYRKVALTVHPQNHAIRVYERCGFRKIGLRNNYHLMLVEL